MVNLINNFILSNSLTFAGIITALLLIVIGTPLISFKGGIPRVGNKIINKGKSILVAILVTLVIFFVISPLLSLLFKLLIEKFLEFTIPILVILCGLALGEWDSKMRWDYRKYWIPFLILGIILLILEIWVY